MENGAKSAQHGLPVSGILLLWFAVLLASYHLNFPPGTIPSHLYTLALAILLLAGAAGIGEHLLAGLIRIEIGSLMGIFIALGTGLGAMELLTLAAASAGISHRAWAWLLMAAGAVAAGRSWRIWKGRWLAFRREASGAAGPGWLKLLLILCAAGWSLALLAALAPAEFYDALIYHLAVPADYLRSGGIVPVPGNYYAHFPANQGMLYMLAMMLRVNPLAAGALCQVLHLLCGASAILVTCEAGRRHFPERTGTLALLLGASVPGLLLISIYPVADLGVTLYGALVLASLLGAAASGGRETGRWVMLAGLFAGLAAGTKYVAILSVIVPATAWLLWQARRLERRRLLHLALFLGCAALLFAPWALRNIVIAGNPAAPYLSGILGGEATGPGLAAELARRGPEEEGAAARALHALEGPWRASTERMGAGGYLGIVFLLLIPFGLIRRGESRFHMLVTVVGLVALALWALSIQVTRYLFPALPALVLLSAAGAETLLGSGRWPRRVLIPALAWVVVHNLYLFAVLVLTIHPFGVVAGVESAEDYLARRVDYYPAARFANEKLPPGSKLLMVGEGRTYYLEIDRSANTPYDEDRLSMLARQAAESGNPLAAWLRGRGYTHLLVNRREMARIARERGGGAYFAGAEPGTRAAIEALLGGAGARILFEKSGVSILEIAAE